MDFFGGIVSQSGWPFAFRKAQTQSLAVRRPTNGLVSKISHKFFTPYRSHLTLANYPKNKPENGVPSFAHEKTPPTHQLCHTIHHNFTTKTPRSTPAFLKKPQQKRPSTTPRKKRPKSAQTKFTFLQLTSSRPRPIACRRTQNIAV
jgi:hypothetical protein